MRVALIAAFVAVMGSSSVAAATLTDFDLTGSGGLAQDYLFEEGGLGLKVSPNGSGMVLQDSTGVGLQGATGRQVLSLRFSDDVSLKRLSLSGDLKSNAFRLVTLDDSGNRSSAAGVVDASSSGSVTNFLFDSPVTSVFAVAANPRAQSFAISGLSVHQVSAIPLPAGVLFLLTAMGGLIMVRRARAVTA
ncbi:MAG: VPLPA-CTERM sorting domain-containing protein [Pseudomonadota bacterium]